MTDLFRWAGYGDTDTPFDHEATSFNPLFVYGIDDGEPCLVYSPIGSQTFIGKSPLGSPATISIRFAIKLTSYPTSSVPFIAPLTSGGTSAWRIRVTSTGTLIIDNPSNTATGTTSAIPLNQWVQVKILASASAVAVRIYNARRGGSLIGAEVVGASTFGLVDNFRMGQAASSPIIPTYRISHLLVTDAATWLPDPEIPDALSATKHYGAVGDSLLAMSGANGELIRQALLTAGVDPRAFYLWGVGGKRIAVPDLTGKTSAQNVQDAKNVLGTIDHWIVALGTNDRPQNDATVNAAIDTLLSAIGGTAKVTWIGLTSKGSASTDDLRVNGLVQAKLTARGNAVFADWDTYIRAIDGGANPSPYWLTTDTTHMTTLGYEKRAEYIVAQLAEAPAPVTGSGVLTLPAATAAGVGSSTVPAFTGTGALALPGLQLAGAGSSAVPAFTGAGALALPALQMVGLGGGVPPVYVGVGALTLPALTAAGVGSVTNPAGVIGAGSMTLPKLEVAGLGVVGIPGSSGVGDLQLPGLIVEGVGGSGVPPITGEGALMLPGLTLSGGDAGVPDEPVSVIGGLIGSREVGGLIGSSDYGWYW